MTERQSQVAGGNDGGAAGAFGGPVTLAVPGQVTDLG
jgi:hypothetical protein